MVLLLLIFLKNAASNTQNEDVRKHAVEGEACAPLSEPVVDVVVFLASDLPSLAARRSNLLLQTKSGRATRTRDVQPFRLT